ncbi:hypothetical protein CBR_g55342 [Chara braunii]|uniref:Peptidase A2 domain-containing protein n=1 Tax=Chara braunii TaxID=69332 RepID=A0A388MCW8_CHABU|nr:hypothetical protein CBR_g55342 [Chara braunii]|eukprot:GBG92407.1 hypothetical protein CBR_g55342 [Chara braunii]
MEEVAGSSVPQVEPEAGELEKVYGKPRDEEPTDKVTAAKKKFRCQIPILAMPEIDDTLSKLLEIVVSVSFQTMLQIDENPESPEEEREEEAPQEVASLQRSRGDLEDLEKAFADIRLSLPDREGGEVMRAPPGTKLSFHALPVGKLKIQIRTHHTDALVDGGAKLTLIRRDFRTIMGCTVNKEVTGSIKGAGGEIPFAGYVTKCAVKAGIRESIWSFQRMTVMEEMDHDIILGRPWCANVEMIGMHLHDGTYMVDIEDPVTGRGKLLRLLGTGGDPSKGKLATWSPSFEDSARKGGFARMEGMRKMVEIMIVEAFNKKEWIKMGLPQKKRRQEDEVLGVMVAEKESEVELRVSLPKRKEVRMDVSEVALEIPDLLQLIKAIRYHYVGVDSAALAKFEGEVRKGYCLNGKLFDYKIERIARIRNKVDGLSRVFITPEGVEDAEPIEVFLEYEGGTFMVDNEMMDEECASGELLIRTLEKGAPAVVAELREGPVTTRGRKEEKDSWGAIVGPKEELITMAVEGGREAVMSLVKSWERKELRWMVIQMQERKDEDQKGKEFFYAQIYEGIFRKIGLLLVGNKQPMKVSIKAREVAERDARKRVCRGPSPLRKGEGIYISSGSEIEEERASVGEGGKADMGDKAQASDEEEAERCEQHESWHGESEGRQDMCDRREDGEERRENPHEERSGHDSCQGRYPDFEEGYERGTKIPYSYDPKNLTGGYSPIHTEEEEDEEEEVQEVIKISSGDERDEISRPREERRPLIHHPREEAFRWEDEFGSTPSHWFQQWLSVIKHEWIIKTRELAKAGVVATPLDFYNEMELREIARRRREIMASGLGVKEPAERQDEQESERVEAHDSNRD